ncbi:MAG: hypothetical protein FVQ77_03095 [Cytophagales bacterium]|nr:hypothetical protein [Cytophagales bacterium]
MKKIIITLILVLLTCIAGYFLYDRWYLPSHTEVWTLIPDDAVIIIESSDLSKEWKDFNKNPIWIDLERTPFLQKISAALSVFDRLMTNYPAFSPVPPKTVETGKGSRVLGGETQNNLVDLFGNKRLTISLHINGKNGLSEEGHLDFDYLLFLPIKRSSDKKMVKYLLKQFKTDLKFKLKARNFKGFRITEITGLPARLSGGQAREVAKGWQAGAEDRFRLAYIIYRNYFIAADTPFLIEDAIRKINSSHSPLPSFLESEKRGIGETEKRGRQVTDSPIHPFTISGRNGGMGDLGGGIRVYVNCKKLPLLLSALLPARPQSSFSGQAGGSVNLEPSPGSYLTHLVSGKFAIASVLDLSTSENKLLLNGFTSGHYLSVFIDQSPQAFSLKKIVPNNTAVLLHYGFDDGIKLKQSLADYRGKEYVEETTHLLKEYGFDVSSIFNRLDNEIGLCLLQPMKGIEGKKAPGTRGVIDKLLFLKVKKINEVIDELIMLANATRLKGTREIKGKTDNDSYRGINIRLLNIKEFPYKIFGNPFIGFERCFFAPVHDYIVLANSQQAIETLIKNIEEENTWGKNIQQNLFLDESISEANLTLIINIPKINSGPGKKDEAKWTGFDLMALQFANIEPPTSIISEQESVISETRDYKFYTSLVLKYQKGESHGKAKDPFTPSYPGTNVVVKTNVELDFPAMTKPYIVKNHYDNSLEIFVQDSHNQIYLLSKSGKILWKKSLREPIVSDVFQVDLYKNAKLQYLFATPDKIYAFDRKGSMVKHYPINLPVTKNEKIQTLSVIDYDNNKNYRFLVSDDNGNIYMYNKEGKNLEGWNPKKLCMAHNSSCKLSSPVTHIKVADKDCIIAVHENGIVNIMNRRGEMRNGFPLDLKDHTISPLYIKKGLDFSNTYFTTVTTHGSLVKFNLAGKVISSKQLTREIKEIRQEKQTTFGLCIDVLQKDWIIVMQQGNKLALFDKKLDLIFEKLYSHQSSISNFAVQYYNFATEIYAIHDKVERKTYLYDLSGNNIIEKPFDSTDLIALMYYRSSKSYNLFKVEGKNIKQLTFK